MYHFPHDSSADSVHSYFPHVLSVLHLDVNYEQHPDQPDQCHLVVFGPLVQALLDLDSSQHNYNEHDYQITVSHKYRDEATKYERYLHSSSLGESAKT